MSAERYVKIRSVEDIPGTIRDLVHLQIVDDKVEAVEVKVGDDFIRIVKNGTYTDDLKVLKTANKERKLKYKVKGTIYGVEITPKEFNDVLDAESFILEHAYRDADLNVYTEEYFVDKTEI